ncbi:hypothetical protein GGF46_005226 [Coemansia sp. RSA 552]|nr:hypothetical protein GGF46_005226 [Coemansia sp. RSA 552]
MHSDASAADGAKGAAIETASVGGTKRWRASAGERSPQSAALVAKYSSDMDALRLDHSQQQQQSQPQLQAGGPAIPRGPGVNIASTGGHMLSDDYPEYLSRSLKAVSEGTAAQKPSSAGGANNGTRNQQEGRTEAGLAKAQGQKAGATNGAALAAAAAGGGGTSPPQQHHPQPQQVGPGFTSPRMSSAAVPRTVPTQRTASQQMGSPHVSAAGVQAMQRLMSPGPGPLQHSALTSPMVSSATPVHQVDARRGSAVAFTGGVPHQQQQQQRAGTNAPQLPSVVRQQTMPANIGMVDFGAHGFGGRNPAQAAMFAAYLQQQQQQQQQQQHAMAANMGTMVQHQPPVAQAKPDGSDAPGHGPVRPQTVGMQMGSASGQQPHQQFIGGAPDGSGITGGAGHPGMVTHAQMAAAFQQQQQQQPGQATEPYMLQQLQMLQQQQQQQHMLGSPHMAAAGATPRPVMHPALAANTPPVAHQRLPEASTGPPDKGRMPQPQQQQQGQHPQQQQSPAQPAATAAAAKRAPARPKAKRGTKKARPTASTAALPVTSAPVEANTVAVKAEGGTPVAMHGQKSVSSTGSSGSGPMSSSPAVAMKTTSAGGVSAAPASQVGGMATFGDETLTALLGQGGGGDLASTMGGMDGSDLGLNMDWLNDGSTDALTQLLSGGNGGGLGSSDGSYSMSDAALTSFISSGGSGALSMPMGLAAPAPAAGAKGADAVFSPAAASGHSM